MEAGNDTRALTALTLVARVAIGISRVAGQSRERQAIAGIALASLRNKRGDSLFLYKIAHSPSAAAAWKPALWISAHSASSAAASFAASVERSTT